MTSVPAVAELSATLGFSAGSVDRMAARRGDAAFLEAEAADPSGRVAAFTGDAPLVPPDAGQVLFAPAAARALGQVVDEIYLGRLDGRPIVAIRIEPAPDAGAPAGAEVADLRGLAVAGIAPAREVAALGLAKSFLSWHRRHGFCAQCGAATAPSQGGWRRDCAACGTQHFPRVDPVAIMLVTHGRRVLLGRQPRFPAGNYSCLAGFIEPGETVEEAVRREVMEEAGVAVGRVVALASQPWPFPASLMIGCHGEAVTDAVTVDRDELEDARWFDRDELAAMAAGTHGGGLRIPPPATIASGMIRQFLRGGA